MLFPFPESKLFLKWFVSFYLHIISPMHYCILDFERSRNQRQGSEFFHLGKWIFMRLFPVAFLTNGVLKVIHEGIELTTPVL